MQRGGKNLTLWTPNNILQSTLPILTVSFVYTMHFKISVAVFYFNFNTHKLWPDQGLWKPITGNHWIASE
jgi:hypothetical protein